MSARTSPIGLARYSREYYDCAMAADRVVGMRKGYEIHAPMPVMFLVAHAVELALKAYLLHSGKTLDDIKRAGHDLIKCWELGSAVGFQTHVPLDTSDLDLLRLLNKLHVSTEMRYIQTGAKELPVFGPLRQLAAKILDGICPLVGYK